MTGDSTTNGVCEEYPDATHVRVTFYPQVWVDDRAVTSTDTETYLVPLEKALTDDGELLVDDTDASDRLAWVEEAPDRARNWDGPFYVTLDEIVTSPDSEREDERGNKDEKTQQDSTLSAMYRHNDVPRWEDLDLDAIDYEARDGLPSGHERTLRALRSKIDSTVALLRRYLRELGVSSGGDLAKVSIPTHLQYRNPFAFDRARRARSAQTTLESQRKRFCQVYADHCAEKTRLREEAEVEDDDDIDDGEEVSE